MKRSIITRIDLEMDRSIRELSKREKIGYREASRELAKILRKRNGGDIPF